MEPRLYILGWTFTDGSVYCVAHSEEEVARYWDRERPPIGMWRQPFPNAEGNSFAYGMWEGLMQGDIGPMLQEEHGAVTYLQTWWSYPDGRRAAQN